MNAALDPALLVDAEPTLVEAMTTWETGALDSVPTMFEEAAASELGEFFKFRCFHLIMLLQHPPSV